MKKIGAYTWALIVLVFVFLTAGLFTLGNARTTGDSVLLTGNETAYYTLNVSGSEKLASVYVNVGETYVESGKTVNISVKTASTTSPSTSTSNWTAFGKEFTMASVYKTSAGEVAHYNWVEFTQDKARTAKKISIKASANVTLNEIVCLNEKGEIIELSVYNPSSNTYTQKRLNQLKAAFDAPNAFSASKDAYYVFSPEEGAYMLSAQNVLAGNEIVDGSVYYMENNFNQLAIAALAGSVAVFGNSVFAIRFPALISACCILVFAFLLLKELLKSEKTAFIFSALLAVGGTLAAVGRFGAPYMMVASALVASVYFMYRFFSKGISAKLSGGENVLLSGVFAAIAMAMDATALIPVIGVLVLFGFGLHRQNAAYKIALSKTEGQEEMKVNEQGESVTVNKAAEKATALYGEKVRLSVGFAVIGFVVVTAMLLLLGCVLCYSAYVRAYDGADVGVLAMVWNGLIKSARGVFTSEFSKGSAVSAFAWFLPLKAATLYAGAETGKYVVWSVLPNVIVTLSALAGFIGATVKVVYGFVKKADSKEALRQRRTYFVLLGGMVAALLAALINNDVCVLSSALFHVFYVGFIPLALHAWENCESGCEKCKKTASVCVWIVVGLAVAAFALTLPATYGFAVPTGWAKAFAWTSFISNGFFK